jgi:SWI/SNF-related matrix-associated actin-dependent regulator 1 of chromatin subfamily A
MKKILVFVYFYFYISDMKKLSPSQIKERLFASIALESDLEVPAPPGCVYRPFQIAGIHYMVSSFGNRHLLGDPMGVGKTIQAIGLINYRGYKRVTIACPASLVLNWKDELLTWLVNETKIHIIKNGKDVIPEDAEIVIGSYSLVSNANILKQLRYGMETELLICDESHYLKNPKAGRTKTILGSGGLMKCAKEVIFISGTQMLNRPIELFGIVDSACPVAIGFRNWFEYAKDFCGAYHDGFGWNVDGASNMNELGQRLRSYLMVRRRKEKVLPQLPDKEARIVFLDPNPASKKAAKKMAKFSLDEIEKNKGNAVGFEGLSEARRELGEAKVPSAIKYLKEKLESDDGKIIVFAHHKDVIKNLEEGLADYGLVSIKGTTAKEKRHANVKAFQNDPKIRVFVGSITAAGVGLTLTAASYIAFVEASWVPGENQQAFDRAHRMGQKNFVLGEFLTFAGTLDEKILKSHIVKNKVIREIMG